MNVLDDASVEMLWLDILASFEGLLSFGTTKRVESNSRVCLFGMRSSLFKPSPGGLTFHAVFHVGPEDMPCSNTNGL